MTPNLLILGGTTEATALCKQIDAESIPATVSFAGRVERPARHPVPRRIGGFGGVEGLVAYLNDNAITHLIDATHPFAAQMSANAVAACAQTNTPLIALSRAPWRAQIGDCWTHVQDIAGAVVALNTAPERVMLAVGRMHLPEFAPNPQHFYLLRLVDAPSSPPEFPDHHVVVSRGPFTQGDDLALMQEFAITQVVSKNAGGTGAYSKIEAARALDLPVLMIDRPALPDRLEVQTPDEVLAWVHDTTERGV